MNEIHFLKEDYLLVLNYDTYQHKILSLNDRSQIHKIINGAAIPTSALMAKMIKGLTLIKQTNYQKINAIYKENTDTAAIELVKTIK